MCFIAVTYLQSRRKACLHPNNFHITPPPPTPHKHTSTKFSCFFGLNTSWRGSRNAEGNGG